MESTEARELDASNGSRVKNASVNQADGGLLSSRVTELTELAQRGLQAMYQPPASFPQTMRGERSAQGPTLRPEGDNVRYAAMVALGLSRLDRLDQAAVLDGSTAAELALSVADRATGTSELGAVALAAWSAAEVAGEYDDRLFGALHRLADDSAVVDTVVLSWSLTAAVAAARLADTSPLAERLAARLEAAQGADGIFPHVLPAASQGRIRAHIGCFADQVYPIQALARLSALSGDARPLAAANRCADQICALQGAAGEWWWHYDIRDGSVVEGFPVYSVHQHAMGPMALFELQEAGGHDHRREIVQGLDWLYTHPQVMDELINPSLGVVWRKVGRREPFKAARVTAAVSTALKPGLHLPGVGVLCPPNRIDYECRPYELGWLLYAWNADSVVNQIGAPRHA